MKDLTNTRISTIDTIYITENQIGKICNWCWNNRELIQKNKNNIRHILKEGIICYFASEGKTYSMQHFEICNENLNFCSYGSEEDDEDFIWLVEGNNSTINIEKGINCFTYEKPYGKNINLICNNEIFQEEDLEIVSKIADQQITLYYAILFYSQLNQETIIKRTRTHTHKIQSKKDKRKGKKPKIKLIKQNIIRLNTNHIPEPTEEERKHYERHTFGWTVRGHWRTYQSGKKVWIKPQVRGDKDKVEGKIYEI